MDSARESKPDLTTTIHLNSLRALTTDGISPLHAASDEEIEVLNQLQPESAMLIALSGPSRGARFLLDQSEISVGRSAGSEIFLDDVTVSRKHCEIHRRNKEFWIHDGGSLNGTYINGRLIDAEEKLVDGVEVQIGKYRLHFFEGGKKREKNRGEKK